LKPETGFQVDQQETASKSDVNFRSPRQHSMIDLPGTTITRTSFIRQDPTFLLFFTFRNHKPSMTMCSAKNITIDTTNEAHGLPIMALPQKNDRAHQLKADYHSSCFEFSYHGLSLELEQLGSKGIMSIIPPRTETSSRSLIPTSRNGCSVNEGFAYTKWRALVCLRPQDSRLYQRQLD
jgi:hypothetical protein